MRKITKYFNLWLLKKLNYSNLRIALSVMNFQKWELFLVHPLYPLFFYRDSNSTWCDMKIYYRLSLPYYSKTPCKCRRPFCGDTLQNLRHNFYELLTNKVDLLTNKLLTFTWLETNSPCMDQDSFLCLQNTDFDLYNSTIKIVGSIFHR